MIGIVLSLAVACSATVLLEWLPVLFVRSKLAWLKASFLCNVVTNPILNTVMLLVASVLMQSNLLTGILLFLEIGVVFLEAFFYKVMLNKAYLQCFVFSFAANLLSFGVGMIGLEKCVEIFKNF